MGKVRVQKCITLHYITWYLKHIFESYYKYQQYGCISNDTINVAQISEWSQLSTSRAISSTDACKAITKMSQYIIAKYHSHIKSCCAVLL